MVSVIIPVYNGEQYLEKCIESVLTQTYRDIQVILVNDGSTDRTLEICETYEQRDARIMVINQENSGVSAARNKGIKEAKGEWISFVDADDWLDKDAFSDALKRDKADVIAWNWIEEYEDRSVKSLYADNEIKASCPAEMEAFRYRSFSGYNQQGRQDRGTNNIVARLIKRSVILNHKIQFDETLKHHEDTMFMLEVFEYADSVELYNCHHYHRRMHEGSVTKTYYPGIVENNLLISRKYQEFLEKFNKGESYYNVYYGFHVFWMNQILQLYLMNSSNPMGFWKRRRLIKEILNTPEFSEALKRRKTNIIRPKKIYLFLGRHHLYGLLMLYSWSYRKVLMTERNK